MPSTFSSLKFELIATGEQDGIWGDTTNTNIGTAIEQAITGSGDVTFSSSDVTLSLTNSNAAQTARNLRLVCTGTSGGARQLIVPNIEKQYIVQNNLADTVTIRTSAGTGIAIEPGKTTVVFNNGTDVVEVVTFLPNLMVENFSANGSAITAINASNISSGTIANGRTTGASANGAATIVLRDSNGSFAGNVITGGSFATQNFSISQSSGKLVFKYGSNVIASMDSTGNFTSATNITAYGTP